MLRKIFKWLPSNTRKTVIHSLVTSKLDYGYTLYSGITKQLVIRLQSIQNSVARLIVNLPHRTLITPHPRELQWLPIDKRAPFKRLTHSFEALHKSGPTYLNSHIFHQPPRHLRSARLLLTLIPHIHITRSGGWPFFYKAPKAWNNLPLHIRASSSPLVTITNHFDKCDMK